jgi:small nuclear ribonucleoprotein (snRNP)-like protein
VDEPSRNGQDPLQSLIGHQVVLDTAGTMIYLGTLTAVADHCFVLLEADVHDCRDGHATKEVYAARARQEGVSMNRHSVIVMRSAVMSVSPLDHVVAE